MKEWVIDTSDLALYQFTAVQFCQASENTPVKILVKYLKTEELRVINDNYRDIKIFFIKYKEKKNEIKRNTRFKRQHPKKERYKCFLHSYISSPFKAWP